MCEALERLGVHDGDEAIRLAEKIFPTLDTREVERLAATLPTETNGPSTDFGEPATRLLKALCIHLMTAELRRLWDRAFIEKETLEQVLPEASSSPGGRVRL